MPRNAGSARSFTWWTHGDAPQRLPHHSLGREQTFNFALALHDLTLFCAMTQDIVRQGKAGQDENSLVPEADGYCHNLQAGVERF